MEYEVNLENLTSWQKDSSKKLTSLVSPEDLGDAEPIIRKLEDEGFSLVQSKYNPRMCSVLMPSGKVLDVEGNKEALDNIFPRTDSDLGHACIYFGFYMTYIAED